jgi:acyl carrier protein
LNTFEKVRRIASEVLDIPESRIAAESRHGPDLGADSLGSSEFMFCLEEVYVIEIPDGEAKGIVASWRDVTIQRIVDWIDESDE